MLTDEKYTAACFYFKMRMFLRQVRKYRYPLLYCQGSSFPILSNRYDKIIIKGSIFREPDASFLCVTNPIDT